MKKQHLPLAGLLSLLLAAGSAFAQSNTLRANIPFDFQIGGQLFPAGSYRISPIGQTSQAFAAVNVATHQADIFVPNRVSGSKPSATTKLVFHAYGDRYFLSQMWIEGSDTGLELQKKPIETRIARRQPANDVMVLAALQ
jgi:hypothetical protein